MNICWLTTKNQLVQETVYSHVGDGVIHLSEMVEILQKRGDEPLDDCEVTVKSQLATFFLCVYDAWF